MRIMPAFAAFALAAFQTVIAVAQGPSSNPPTWVLLGLTGGMGAVFMRDTALDTGTPSDEGLPVYQTKAACEAALRHAIQKYAGLSHAEGNYGMYLCSNLLTWTRGK